MTSELPPRRLHPAGAIVATLDNVRDALITFVIVVVIGSQSSDLGPGPALLLAFGGAIVAGVYGYLQWRSETYEIADAAIRHRSGPISPDETVVPLSRVHSIDTTQGLIQRLFGIYELHVQTAGGGVKGEIVLRAVSPEEARELRAAAGLPEPAATDLPSWSLSLHGLLLVGLTAPQLGVLLPLVGGAFALGDNVLGDSASDTLADRLPTEPHSVALLILAALLAAWLLSFLGAIVAFAGFTVERDGDNLRIRRGVLERRVTSVPLRRVHAISIAEGPLRRPFGLCSVRLETAGYGEEPAAARTLFPLLRTTELDARLGELVPVVAGGLGDLARPPARALRRYVLPEVLITLAATAIVTLVWTWAWPSIPALALLAGLDGLARYRSAGWRLSGGALALRRGSLTRRTLLARADRLQDHSLMQTPIQRRAQLADFAITVASGADGRVSELDATTASNLFTRVRPAA